ncbi:TIGR01777 family protein [Lacihabitans sp. LS3-19]|uniref:TIGR01777 family oxidoreductase n=1 Tax=Lacihabitans sp. LS3-19 TaxID=2487335 RepID=UPI0020CBEDD2|nr:TIGR01777 family oxidoreductase [Lacihabitans sp. LS3-19]MCP9770381.1 TIGR01777 family protein [Lacihabitans sp. LS3-19]
MKVVIAGGNGFLGNALEEHFIRKNNEVFILSRKPKKANHIYWDARNLGPWSSAIENSDVLINLTGKSVDCRYTEKNKKEILNSRVLSTRILQSALEKAINPPKVWLNASSATIYIHAERLLMSEASGIIGDDFSMGICKIWEEAFFEKSSLKIRKIALRTSIVLGNNGGALPKIKTICKIGLGGKNGSGKQKMSWIHVNDFCKAVDFLIEKENIFGSINITAPKPVSNEEFMKNVRELIGIGFGLNTPVALLELASLLLRTETELLLKSRNVVPERLLKEGFEFEFPEIESALKDLIQS